MRVDSGLPVPIPSPRQVRLRYREVPRRAEIRGACCARYRSGNGRQADGEPHGDRRLVIAGGWLEVAVELASVIDVGTVLLRRPRAGMGAVRVLSRPGPGGCRRNSREAAASPGCGKRILARAAWCHFMAGDGRWCLAWNSAVYVGAFCGSDEEGGSAPFQGCAEAGYRAKQDMRKPDICMDRARSIHTIAAIHRTPVNPWREISR